MNTIVPHIVSLAAVMAASVLASIAHAPVARAQSEGGIAAVVVASTAPEIKRGRQLRTGESLDIPRNAVVTIVDGAGQARTLRGRAVIAAPAGRARQGWGDAVSRLAQRPGQRETGGFARAGSVGAAMAPGDPPVCATMAPTTSLADQIDAGCTGLAEATIARAAAETPVTLSLYRVAQGEGWRPQAIASIDGFLACRVERGARAVRTLAEIAPVLASEPAVLAPLPDQTGAMLACIAFANESDARAALSAWPRAASSNPLRRDARAFLAF